VVDLPLLLPHEAVRTEALARGKKEADISIPDLAKQVLLDRYTPPAVLVNETGDILYVNGRTASTWSPRPARRR
jgi:two-component system CheB/CheR fusion protein